MMPESEKPVPLTEEEERELRGLLPQNPLRFHMLGDAARRVLLMEPAPPGGFDAIHGTFCAELRPDRARDLTSEEWRGFCDRLVAMHNGCPAFSPRSTPNAPRCCKPSAT